MLNRLRHVLGGVFCFMLSTWVAAQPIDTNQRYFIQEISLAGNEVTKDYILLRELEFQAGDSISGQQLDYLLERSENNIFNTALFNSVQLIPYTCGDQSLEVLILVSERWYVWPLPIVENADRNFNTWWQNRDLDRLSYGIFLTWNNFRGRNEILRAKVQTGFEQQFALGYAFPYIDKKRRKGLSFGVGYSTFKDINYASSENRRVFYKDENEPQQEEFYANMGFQFRGKLYASHSASLGYTHVSVSDSIQTLSEEFLKDNLADNRFLSLSYQFKYDKRDYIQYPLKGMMFQARLVRHGLGLGDDIDVFTFHGTLNQHLELSDRWYWASGLRGKWNLGELPPYYFQRGLGYSDFVRGYELYVMDAESYGVVRNNLKWTLVQPKTKKFEIIPVEEFQTVYFAAYLNAFTDIGYASDTRYEAVNPLSNEWLVGYGMGLDMVTYYDLVLRLEYSFNLENESGFFIHFQKSI